MSDFPVASCKKSECISRWPILWRGVTVLSLLLVCEGCWDEIQYEPTQSASPSTQPQPIQEQIEAEKETVTVPLADELFVTEEPPPQPTTSQVADTFPPPSTLPKSRTALAVWQASSQWSLAAAYFAKGLGENRYGDPLERAKYAARLVEIDLPDFSSLKDDGKRQARVASFLLDQPGSQFVKQVAENDEEPYAALAELAMKTHALLLVYNPLNEDLNKFISAIQTTAEKSTLPVAIWNPLVDLLERHAPFQDVKQAVFQLHERITAYLSNPIAE